jgi:hypothetical protein
MAYVEPTAATFKARFPAFAAVSDSAIESALSEASRRVDTTWTEGDYTTAKLLYAAHVLTMDGLGSSNEARLAGFKRVKIGPMDLERAVTDAKSSSSLRATSYGARFAELARLNFAGGTVI